MTQLLPRFHAASERIDDERKIAQAVLDGKEAPSEPKSLRRALAKPGDPRVLRAIPVIARGVGGTIPGTEPLAALITSEGVR